MGILAEQAMQRLRRVVAAHDDTAARAPADRRMSFLSGGTITAAFLVLASAAFLVRPVTAPVEAIRTQSAKPAMPTGRAAFPLADGVTCRELVFDRAGGDIVDSKTAPCDSIARNVSGETERHSAFSWGKK